MKAFVFILLTLFVFACQTQKEQPKVVKKYTIKQFYKNKNIYGGRFSADESKLLVTSNETDIYNVWALPVDGSASQQLTNSTEESFFSISYFPKDERFIFTFDKGGDENDQLFVQELDGTVISLTPWEGSKSTFYGWARDFNSFFFTSVTSLNFKNALMIR